MVTCQKYFLPLENQQARFLVLGDQALGNASVNAVLFFHFAKLLHMNEWMSETLMHESVWQIWIGYGSFVLSYRAAPRDS